jgi:nucleoside-diphosphate-sugar epimerase
MSQQNLALITGVSGFIAKHVALRFLQTGWAVRGTLRNLDRADATGPSPASDSGSTGEP